MKTRMFAVLTALLLAVGGFARCDCHQYSQPRKHSEGKRQIC